MKKLLSHSATFILLGVVLLAVSLNTPDDALAGVERSSGQTVLLPFFLDIYSPAPMQYEASFSLHNADKEHPLTLMSVEYYDGDGKLTYSFLKQPAEVSPLATRSGNLTTKDLQTSMKYKTGSFLIKWQAKENIVSPVIIEVVTGTGTGMANAFAVEGKVIEDLSEKEASIAPQQ